MRYLLAFGLFVFILAFLLASSYADELSLSLTYLARYNIEDESEGLNEPSGLALSHGKNALWTISDDTDKIFKLGLDGELKEEKSFTIPIEGFEGITLDPGGEFLFTIKEEHNVIITIQVDPQEVVARKGLAEMTGYDTVKQYFPTNEDNKGLEGITWNTTTGTIFVIKEGHPGVLIEVSSDLQTIQRHKLLNDENGFFDIEVTGDQIDFSGICYDARRDRFWIVSDKAERLYMYDWKENTVIQSFRLGYGKDGEYREIEKAEGVAIDPDSNRLYVVSDKEVRLYVFDIRE